jgi:hypothetical protein
MEAKKSLPGAYFIKPFWHNLGPNWHFAFCFSCGYAAMSVSYDKNVFIKLATGVDLTNYFCAKLITLFES